MTEKQLVQTYKALEYWRQKYEAAVWNVWNSLSDMEKTEMAKPVSPMSDINSCQFKLRNHFSNKIGEAVTARLSDESYKP